MSSVLIELVEKQKVKIENLSVLSSRAAMKMNIFIGALKDVKISKDDNKIDITYLIDDEYAIVKSIKEVISFLASGKVDVLLGDNLTYLLKETQEKLDVRQDKIEQLRAIKSETEKVQTKQEEFQEFSERVLCIRLRDYQIKSARLMSTAEGGFDFSVPGAGKTIITYAAYARMKSMGVVDNMFVIGPGSAYNAWYEEHITCFGTLPDFENLAAEPVKDCKAYLKSSESFHKEISFINYEKIRMVKNEVCGYLARKKTLLIIDEGHKIKNPKAAVTEATLEIAKYASARIILTGTPMPNGYEDLFALTKVLSPFIPILPYKYMQLKAMTSNGASENEITKIHECLAPFYSRISKKYLIDKGELLPYETKVVRCQMDDEQVLLYKKLNEFCGKMSDDIDEDLLMNLKKAILIRKMQISANPALLKKSLVNSMDELREAEYGLYNDGESDISKLIDADRIVMDRMNDSSIFKIVNMYDRRLKETNKNMTAVSKVCQLVADGKKVLVWDIFVYNMNILKGMLEEKLGNVVELINGTVSKDERQEAISRFRNQESMVLLANPATLAESISLHKICQNAIYVNRNFNAAQFIQSKDRIHRINMPEGTTAHYYFVENAESVDIKVSSRLDMKEKRMLSILDSDDITIGGAELEDVGIMSDQDILDCYSE